MTGRRVEVRRIYEDPEGGSGEYRVLVDRLWPRGVAKDSVRIDEWARDLAPSTELRRWYGHDPGRFDEFSRRYRRELAVPAATGAADRVRSAAGRKRVVLLTATRDVAHSGAVVLAGHLEDRG